MTNDEFADFIATLYPLIYHRAHTRWDKDEYRPSPESLAVLTHLEMSGPLTISEAAAHFDRAQSAMSELVDRLETAGLVERLRDSRDKRRMMIWLSELGTQVLRKSQNVLDRDVLSACAEILNKEEREQVVNALQKLVTAFDIHFKFKGDR